MITFNGTVFDETISGTAATWYSPAELNDPLGMGDGLAFTAAVTNVTGTTTLTVRVEQSADGQNWVSASTPELSTSIESNSVYIGARIWPYALSFARLRVNLSGTAPQCRLKLGVTTRSG